MPLLSFPCISEAEAKIPGCSAVRRKPLRRAGSLRCKFLFSKACKRCRAEWPTIVFGLAATPNESKHEYASSALCGRLSRAKRTLDVRLRSKLQFRSEERRVGKGCRSGW